jgi:bifunctional ADP-heptose synthase (sugar kinase/adenylyltransferase)
MSKEMEFFIFLLEQYSNYKNLTADKILKQWDELDLTNFIYDMYERYHVERLQNAFNDIDELIVEKNNNLGTA